MIAYNDLQALAATLLAPAEVDEARIRVAMSAIYYGLFHHLTAAASTVFDGSGRPGAALAAQVTRAFSHTSMRKVCDAYIRSKKQRLPPPLDRLHAAAPDGCLIGIADVFVRLQEARETADYDLQATMDQAEVLLLLQQAEAAHWGLEQIQHLPETRIFLAALLLADRWTRRA